MFYPQGEFAQMAFEQGFEQMLNDELSIDPWRNSFPEPSIGATVGSTQEESIINTFCLEHETEKAYLLNDDYGKFWIPKSVFELTKIKKNNKLKGGIPSWFTKNYLKD